MKVVGMEIDEIDSSQPGHVQRVVSKFEELLLQRIEVKEEVCDEETSDIDVPSTQKDTNNEANKSAESTNCSLCTLSGEHRAASCFCTSCEIPEPLFDECSRHHIRQRNMRDHSLSTDMNAIITYLENNVINCELCLLDGEQRAATSFCLTCKEPEALCKDCAAQHMKQKAFRSHQISNDIAKLSRKEKLLCEPCTTEGAKTRADSFCKDCDEPEPLCKKCAVEHIKQRQFRNHSICDDISQIPLKANENSRVLCTVCKEEGTDTEATCFCKDCDDQEPLCPKCARQHTRQKVFRGHNLCKDLSLLQTLGKEKVLCDNCKADGKDVLADAYCKDCSDSQPLCNRCADHHVKQRKFRNHKIERDISLLITLQKELDEAYNICKIDGKCAKATKYCYDCDEYLCTECIEIHLKFTPEHVLTDKLNSCFPCEPCKREKRSESADSFCENCKEPMCRTCSQQHLKQKPSRGHIISSNMLKFFKLTSKKRKC